MSLANLLLLPSFGVMHPHPLILDRARYERFAVYGVQGSGGGSVVEGMSAVGESAVNEGRVSEEREDGRRIKSSRFERDEGHVVA